MAEQYTHQQIQEELKRQGAPEGFIREAINAAMVNITHSHPIRLPLRQRLLVYIGHDKFELH